MDDSNNFTLEKCEAFAQTHFQNTQFIHKFAEKHKHTIMSVLSKPDTNYRDDCIKGLWSRVYFWLCSLNKLNAVIDFQAFASANRALLEITVDLALLHQDKTNSSGWKMWWWNLSEKLKGAKQIVKFFADQNFDIPDSYNEQQDFINREEQIILHMRNMLWNGKHPKRWTGRENLFDDLIEADKFLGNSATQILNMSLTQYYRTEYRRMNWYIHSGVSSFWNLPKESFPLLSAFFLMGCADFALLSTQIVIKDFRLDAHLPNYNQELEKLKFEKLESHIRNMEMQFSDNLSDYSDEQN